MDFLSRQKKLQAEAKLALAMAKPMAKMQVEVEKQNRKKSPVADLVSQAAHPALLAVQPFTQISLCLHLTCLLSAPSEHWTRAQTFHGGRSLHIIW